MALNIRDEYIEARVSRLAERRGKIPDTRVARELLSSKLDEVERIEGLPPIVIDPNSEQPAAQQAVAALTAQ